MDLPDELKLTIADRVALLTLNRPERLNAFTAEMLYALIEALQRLGSDPAVGAVVLTGAGRGFCSGGDVKRMSEGPAPEGAEAVAVLRGKMEVSRLLHECPKPTIAMVNGVVAGAGTSLALACDLRFLAAGARFTTAFAKVGLPGDFGGSFFLTALVGAAKARELYFTAESVDAERALALGIVNRVVPDAELAAVTMAFARDLANGPTAAFAMMKRSLNRAISGTLADVLDAEAESQVAAASTVDHREAARAFVEKRKPVFRGH